MEENTRNSLMLALIVIGIGFSIFALIFAAVTLDRINDEHPPYADNRLVDSEVVEETEPCTINCDEEENIVYHSCVDEEYDALLALKDVTATIYKPIGWSLEQSDEDGVSRFILTQTEGDQASLVVSFHQPLNYETEEPVIFEKWLMDNGFAIPIESDIMAVDSTLVSYYPTSTIFGYQNSYVAELDPENNIFLEISRTTTIAPSDEMDAIIHSLNLNPTEAEIARAKIIDCQLTD